ncbi:DUF3817 domain-containing protein [Fimbriiglobus ruber]|uniref:DUF3817 domain-containing protein n=1 Tax=Fimbriiglobus ruber TaxID=1908690 RepID=A0A225DG39_9BACT|nr:DUF3817 domain-containing protein [Fimbriiglobus ruber]OWK37478.1 hypothetical protein FRUB_06598 [Fimbriiglobus ruber]
MLNTPVGRLRAIGFVEGISFLLLLGVAMPLKYLADMPLAVRVVGTAHGVLFLLFFAAVAEVTVRRPWWSVKFWATAAVASVVPGGTFLFDVWLRRNEEARAAQNNLAVLAEAERDLSKV